MLPVQYVVLEPLPIHEGTLGGTELDGVRLLVELQATPVVFAQETDKFRSIR